MINESALFSRNWNPPIYSSWYISLQSSNEGNSASRFAGQSSISSAQYFDRPDELTYGKLLLHSM